MIKHDQSVHRQSQMTKGHEKTLKKEKKTQNDQNMHMKIEKMNSIPIISSDHHYHVQIIHISLFISLVKNPERAQLLLSISHAHERTSPS